MKEKALFKLCFKGKIHKIEINPNNCIVNNKMFDCEMIEEIDGHSYKLNIFTSDRPNIATVRIIDNDRLIAERHNVPIRYYRCIFKKR